MARLFPIALLIGIAPTLAMVDGATDKCNAASASKKTQRKSQPAPQVRTSPDVTGTIPSAAKKDPAPQPTVATDKLATDKDDESIPPPFNLPKASRMQMRSCGERWQTMKMSGQAGDQTWRAYATKCLASKNGPDDATAQSPHP